MELTTLYTQFLYRSHTQTTALTGTQKNTWLRFLRWGNASWHGWNESWPWMARTICSTSGKKKI